MNVLLSVFTPDESDVQICHVDITPELAEELIRKVELAKHIQKRDPNFRFATFSDYTPTFYTISDLMDAGLDEDFLDKIIDDGDWRNLDDEQALQVGVAVDTAVDSEQVLVWADGDVLWTGWHSDHAKAESSTFGRRILERIAIEHPKHLMKLIAFGYEIPV